MLTVILFLCPFLFAAEKGKASLDWKPMSETDIKLKTGSKRPGVKSFIKNKIFQVAGCKSQWSYVGPPGSEARGVALGPDGTVCAVGNVTGEDLTASNPTGGKNGYIRCYHTCGQFLGDAIAARGEARDMYAYGLVFGPSNVIYWIGSFHMSTIWNLWVGRLFYDFSKATPIEFGGGTTEATSGEDEARSIAKDNSGNLYVTGFFGYDNSPTRIWVAKFVPYPVQEMGALPWDNPQEYQSSVAFGNAWGYGIALDSTGKIYVHGVKDDDYDSVVDGKQMLIGRYIFNTANYLVQDPSFGSSGYYSSAFGGVAPGNIGRGIAVSNSNRVVATGQSEAGHHIFLWLAISTQTAQGQTGFIWISSPVPSVNRVTGVVGEGVVFSADGNTFYVIGTSGVTSAQASGNIWVRAYAVTGAPLWTKTFDSGSSADKGYAIAVDGNSMYIAGVYDNKFYLKKEPLAP